MKKKENLIAIWMIFGVMLSAISWASDPNFVVNPDYLFNDAFEAGIDPDPNVLNLSYIAGPSLNWMIDITAQPGWLIISQTAGTLNPGQSTAVYLSYDITGLTQGEYEYMFDILDSSSLAVLDTITVKMKIIGAILDVDRHLFSHAVYMGDPDPDPNVIVVSNPGVKVLNWLIDDSLCPAWLAIDPIDGAVAPGMSQAVTLHYDISAASTGLNKYTFQISDSDAECSPQNIDVNVDVTGPSFEVDQTNFDFVFDEGAQTMDQTITLANTGGGVVNWSAALINQPAWLSVTPSGGTLSRDESVAVTLAVDIASLVQGQYSYTFEISDPALANSTYQISIRVWVDTTVWDIRVPDDYSTIQAAIDAAQYGDRIYVAEGTYVENITLKNGVVLIGESVEDCIINGNQNGFPVVRAGLCDSTTRLEGFTVTNGNADSGGGLHSQRSDLFLSKCKFTENTSLSAGGAIYCDKSGLTIKDCVLNNNIVVQGKGGGLFAANNKSKGIKIVSSVISHNSASKEGGGICNEGSITLIDCRIEDNNSENGMGGGLYNRYGAAIITDSLIEKNYSSNSGGGIHTRDGSLNIKDSILTGNSSDGGMGGGIYISSVAASINNCLLTGNHTRNSGGAVGVGGEKSVEIINCSFYGNTVGFNGGAIWNAGKNLRMINSILWGNVASGQCNEVYNNDNSWDKILPVISYCNIAGSGGSGDAWDVQLGTDGGGNIDADPLFIDPDGPDGIIGTADDNLRLQNNSPCIDAGDNTAVLPSIKKDLEGGDRFIDIQSIEDTGKGAIPIVDMGAYETESGETIWVNQNYSQNSDTDGHVWQVDAFTEIQDGIDAAGYGDIVKVAPGFYRENIIMKNGVTLIASENSETVIIGDYSDSVVRMIDCDSNTLLSGFLITNGYAVSGGGVYVSNGGPTISECIFELNEAEAGGAMSILYSNPHISNCTFHMNSATGAGGGIYISGGDVIEIEDCIFSGNSSAYGGGISGRYWGTYATNLTIENCLFIRNRAGNLVSNGWGGGAYITVEPVLIDCRFIENKAYRGGGLYLDERLNSYNPDFLMRGCQFINNTSCNSGGGLYLYSLDRSSNTASIISHCTFVGNSVPDSSGGGMAAIYFNGLIHNCTFSDNFAGTSGGGMSLYNKDYNPGPIVTNCIFWSNNAGSSGSEVNNSWTGFPTFRYCNIAGSSGSGGDWDTSLGIDGGGNIDVDPLFTDPNDGNYSLQSQAGRWDVASNSWMMDDVTSPCIDAGDPYDSFADEPFPNGGVLNMGAYGGTEQASKSYFGEPACEKPYAGDINGDCRVDLLDMSMMAMHWLEDHQTQ